MWNKRIFSDGDKLKQVKTKDIIKGEFAILFEASSRILNYLMRLTDDHKLRVDTITPNRWRLSR
jgi:hypothetical protein